MIFRLCLLKGAMISLFVQASPILNERTNTGLIFLLKISNKLPYNSTCAYFILNETPLQIYLWESMNEMKWKECTYFRTLSRRSETIHDWNVVVSCPGSHWCVVLDTAKSSRHTFLLPLPLPLLLFCLLLLLLLLSYL